jgi:3-hydroxyisobutyrate dehydrogenase-like beta-hydroxyacid dehydrogenase
MIQQKIGFIGLGNMGLNMAKNLIKEGYHLQVYNRTASKVKELGEAGVTLCKTPAEAATDVQVLITMLSEDNIVKQTVTGAHGILKTFPAKAVHISMSTIGPDTSEELAKLHEAAGSHYIAAPVFGRPIAAADKKLWICTSGNKDAKEIAQPVLECLGQGIFDFGGQVGGANVLKIAGNFMIMASLEMMAEAFTLAEKNGLDRTAVANFFGSTLFNAPIFHNYGKLVANKQYEPVGFTATLGYKDARLAVKLAQLGQTPMPAATLAHDRLLSAVAKGWGERDFIEGISRGVSEDAGT